VPEAIMPAVRMAASILLTSSEAAIAGWFRPDQSRMGRNANLGRLA